MPYTASGEEVTARDVLDDEELRAYTNDQRNWTGRAMPAGRARVLRDEQGYVSLDGGRTWGWEPGGRDE